MSKRNFGFTLVELLVVITIIGLLVAIALPALATVREQARKTQCSNNLRELAKAVSSYELKKERFPSSFTLGWYDSDADGVKDTAFLWTWVPQLLPELDLQDHYDQLFDNADPQTVAAPPADIDSPLYLHSFPVLVCPSDTTVTRGAGDMSYVANMGRQDDARADSTDTSVPDYYDNVENGVFHNRVADIFNTGGGQGREIGNDDIKDGKAYTLLITENLNAMQWWRWWAPGTDSDSATFDDTSEAYTGVLWYTQDPIVRPDGTPITDGAAAIPIIGVNQDPDPASLTLAHARPSSRHQGGFNACFVDGSVKFIDEEIVYHTYRQLMATDDTRAAYGATPRSLNIPTAFDPADLDR